MDEQIEFIDAAFIASDLKLSERHVSDRYVYRPGFPTAVWVSGRRCWVKTEYLEFKRKLLLNRDGQRRKRRSHGNTPAASLNPDGPQCAPA